MPRDKARYILHPDFVISANDQQRHYVSARALAKLYKVPFGNCIIISSVDTGRSRGLKLEDYVHLHPQSDGNYTLPAGGCVMAEENGLKDIEMVSLAVQIEGIAYFVNLGQEELKVLVRLAAGMRVPPELKVVKAPEGFALMDIKDMV